MFSITAQQIKLDLELVPKEKRLVIGKCNGRLNLGKIQREPTFQVVLDALALTLCYSVFLITTNVLEINMHQFWDSSTGSRVIQVALKEDAQFEEARRKSMRDFHKTHPSGSGAGNDEDDSNNEQESIGEDNDQTNDSDDDKIQSNNENESDSEHETNENESGLESDQEENEEDKDDEEEVKDKLVKTPSNDSDDEDETNITDKPEGNEDKEMDYTTSQLYDDIDIRLNEPVDTDKGFVQEEGTDAAMTNVHQGSENPKIIQVIEDAYVTLSTIPQKTKVPVTSSSHSTDLSAKFLNFLDIPRIDAEIVSPMDVHVHHEVPSKQTPILLTLSVSVITDSSPWDEKNASRDDLRSNFRPLFIGKDSASVGENRGVKGCTIIAIIYDFEVTAGDLRRTI
ncbi:hypothetical protein Tco_0038678 [Tanacetum coccineum]